MPDCSSDGVFYLKSQTASLISYPAAVYEEENPEDLGYWANHRVREIRATLKKLGASCIIEVGAGTGAVSVPLSIAGIDVVAIEPIRSGAEKIASKRVTAICGVLEDLHLPDNSVPNYGVFDVLEHLVNPGDLVTEMFRTLTPRGFLVVTVPSGQWLWGVLDESLGHHRRYTRKRLHTLLSAAGFQKVSMRYTFLLLVLPAFFLRAVPYRLGFIRSEKESIQSVRKQQTPNHIISSIVTCALKFESIVSRIIGLPYGLTILAVYTKPEANRG